MKTLKQLKLCVEGKTVDNIRQKLLTMRPRLNALVDASNVEHSDNELQRLQIEVPRLEKLHKQLTGADYVA